MKDLVKRAIKAFQTHPNWKPIRGAFYQGKQDGFTCLCPVSAVLLDERIATPEDLLVINNDRYPEAYAADLMREEAEYIIGFIDGWDGNPKNGMVKGNKALYATGFEDGERLLNVLGLTSHYTSP